MSTIYLPNGGHINIHNSGWAQQTLDNGVSIIRANDDTVLVSILPSGLVHVFDACRHTYYPPRIESMDEAYRVIEQDITSLSHYKLSALKKLLELYNAKTGSWK